MKHKHIDLAELARKAPTRKLRRRRAARLVALPSRHHLSETS